MTKGDDSIEVKVIDSSKSRLREPIKVASKKPEKPAKKAVFAPSRKPRQISPEKDDKMRQGRKAQRRMRELRMKRRHSINREQP